MPTLALTLIFLTRSSSPAKGCIILPLVHSLDNKLSLFSGAARNSGNEVHEILVNLTPKIPYYPNLPQFQGVRPDHMRFESSKSLFLGELVTYDPWHVLRACYVIRVMLRSKNISELRDISIENVWECSKVKCYRTKLPLIASFTNLKINAILLK